MPKLSSHTRREVSRLPINSEVICMFEILETVLTVGPQIIAGATAVTLATNSTSSNPWINLILRALNYLSGNFGKNKNADG